MTAARKRAEPAARPSALEVFIAHAGARALLWQAGEIELHEAVDGLQAAAVRDGLVDQLGQDEVQCLMAEAFGAVRDDLNPLVSSAFLDDAWSVPGWREAAAEYHRERKGQTLVVEMEPERLVSGRRLLADDVSLERAWAEVSKPSGVAGSTLQAVEVLLQQKDPARLRSWLDRHTTQERKAILQHLERRKRARA